MEVKTSKQLHRHAAPIVMIVMTFFVVAIVSASSKIDSVTVTEATLAKSLVTNLVKIEPKPNGLAKVELNDPKAQENKTPKAGASLHGLSQAGRDAQISLTLQ